MAAGQFNGRGLQRRCAIFRIRFHGRGGQGIKTASRILGTALLLEGFEVQDAPRYGAERRGAPISAYVRAARRTINERGIIRCPDLVVVADETLVPVPAAGVMAGVVEGTVVLIDSHEPGEEWRRRLNAPRSVLALPAPAIAEHEDLPLLGVACAGAAARLLGCVSAAHLDRAIRVELPEMPKERLTLNLRTAREAYEAMAPHEGTVREAERSFAEGETGPAWVDVPLDAIERAGPAVYGGATSVEVRTGLWRILRPVIDLAQCNRCIWVCGTFCPDNAIAMDEDGYPAIDYEHCKGCMICLAQCPPHAIHAVPEFEAQAREREEAAA